MKIIPTAKLVFLCIFPVILLFVTGCKREEGNCEKTVISTYNQDESHHNGQNCMDCHYDGGDGEGCFNTAGSVYEENLTTPLINATVRLYTQPNGAGDLKATIEVDAKGNFFNTDVIYGATLYPAVSGLSGTTQYMAGFVTSGACNKCHGITTDRIWAK